MQEKSFRIGVIGLGIIGSAISKHLLNSNHQVIGFDIDRDKVIKSNGNSMVIVKSLEALFKDCEIIISCLPNEQSLNDTIDQLITLNDSMVNTFIEMSTLSIECKLNNKSKLESKNIHLMDCPISGTGQQASEADIVIYASGDEETFEEVKLVFKPFSKKCFYLGTFGNGSKVKLIANLLVSIHNVASAEAILLAEQTGLDVNKIFEVISSGAGSSKIFELRAPMMIKKEYIPATMKMNVWEKDMALIRELINLSDVPTPLFTITEQLYKKALHMGLGEEDTAAVYEALRKIDKNKSKEK